MPCRRSPHRHPSLGERLPELIFLAFVRSLLVIRTSPCRRVDAARTDILRHLQPYQELLLFLFLSADAAIFTGVPEAATTPRRRVGGAPRAARAHTSREPNEFFVDVA